MTKKICDICKTNEATRNFRVKELTEVYEITKYGVFPEKAWLDIDICESCIKQIAEGVKKEKKE